MDAPSEVGVRPKRLLVLPSQTKNPGFARVVCYEFPENANSTLYNPCTVSVGDGRKDMVCHEQLAGKLTWSPATSMGHYTEEKPLASDFCKVNSAFLALSQF